MTRKKAPAPVKAKAQPESAVSVSIESLQQRITELEQALQTASAGQQRQGASVERSEFLGRMSHEIRTPINAIIGMVHLLHDTDLSKQQAQYIDNIDFAGQALLSTIDDILDYTRLHADTLVLRNDHVNLDQLLKSIAHQVQRQAENKGLEVVYQVDPSVPQFLRGDANRIRQILCHLLDNAIKFTPSGYVQLNIDVKNSNQNQIELAFTITDTGIGINQDRLAILFDAFSQGDETSSRPFGGTGLGLSICRQLIERMGGQIQVDSEVDKGTQVHFSIICDHSQIGAQAIRENPLRFSDVRTLIVDDNPIAGEILCKTSQHLKLHTELVPDANTAIQRLLEQADTAQPFQLVLMDYKMPVINGLIASKLIKENPRLLVKPNVILISAYDQEEIFGNDRPDYIDGYLHKPVTHSSLFDSVADAFGAHLLDPQNDHANHGEVSLERAHILLVEDNLVNQKVGEGLLKRRGAKVTIANHGQEALDLLAKHRSFDIILMDMDMPVMDGYDATCVIRSNPAYDYIPIIAMTAHVLQQDRERCLEAGMNDYLTKPVKPALLYETLLKYLQPHPEKG